MATALNCYLIVIIFLQIKRSSGPSDPLEIEEIKQKAKRTISYYLDWKNKLELKSCLVVKEMELRNELGLILYQRVLQVQILQIPKKWK